MLLHVNSCALPAQPPCWITHSCSPPSPPPPPPPSFPLQVPPALPPPSMRAAVGDGEVYVLGASGNRAVAPLRRFQVGDGLGVSAYWAGRRVSR